MARRCMARGLLVALALFGAACRDAIRLDTRVELGAPSRSTPLVTAGHIAVGTELGLTVLERDGRKRCAFPTGREVVSAPRQAGPHIVFGATDYVIYAVDAQCREAWRFRTLDRVKSDVLIDGERVVATSYDGHVYALEAATGRRLWLFPSSEPSAPSPPPDLPGDFSYSSPALGAGLLFVGNLDGHLYALEASTGSLRWRSATGGAVTSTPAVHQGVVYVGSNDRHVYAFEAATGALRWKRETGDWVNSSPRVQDDVLYVGSNDRHVYALELASGEVRWKAALAGPAVAIPAVFRNLLFVAGGSGDGAVYALERASGALFWKHATDGGIESDPVVDGEQVFVSSSDGKLYAFDVVKTTHD